jgi:hypothetical protein
MSTTTYSLQTVRDIILTTDTTTSSQPGQYVTSFQNTFQTLSNTNQLFRLEARSIILTRKPGSVWPLVNANMIDPYLDDTDYFLQITIPNALRPLEMGNLDKSNVFCVIDLRELYDTTTPLHITFADFRPIVYRFYNPSPEAFFSDFSASYSSLEVQFTNSKDVDHVILDYATLQIACHIEGLNYALSSGK